MVYYIYGTPTEVHISPLVLLLNQSTSVILINTIYYLCLISILDQIQDIVTGNAHVSS